MILSLCVCQTGSRPSVLPCWTALRRKTLTSVKTMASSSTQHSKYVTLSTTAEYEYLQSVTLRISNNIIVGFVCSIFGLTVHRWTEGRPTEVRHTHTFSRIRFKMFFLRTVCVSAYSFCLEILKFDDVIQFKMRQEKT